MPPKFGRKRIQFWTCSTIAQIGWFNHYLEQIYIYTYISVCIYKCIYIYIFCGNLIDSIYIYIYICIITRMLMYIYLYFYIHMNKHVFVVERHSYMNKMICCLTWDPCRCQWSRHEPQSGERFLVMRKNSMGTSGIARYDRDQEIIDAGENNQAWCKSNGSFQGSALNTF